MRYLKIVSWNCNRAFRNKFQYIQKLNADLYIIEECENPEKIIRPEYLNYVKSSAYKCFKGDKKGLLVFSPVATINPVHWNDNRMRYYLPFNFLKHHFLGVWTKDNYIEDLYLYSSFNIQKLKNRYIIGDFNSNVMWDRKHGYRTHSDFNKLVSKVGLGSAYHMQTGDLFGQEKQATFYLYRKPEKPYYIDYAYLPEKSTFNITFGDSSFLQYSDHLPLILNVK